MSNLSELLPVGGGQNTADYVAKGSIGAGIAVTINFDGTVSAVSENNSAITNDPSIPDEANSQIFLSTFTDNAIAIKSCYSAKENLLFVAYRNISQSNRATVNVGYVQGKKILWTDSQTIENNAFPTAIIWDDSQSRGIISYRNSSNYQTIRAFQVASGEFTSVGSGVVLESVASYEADMVYYVNEGFSAIFYQNASLSPAGRVISGTGTTLTVSSIYQAPLSSGSYFGGGLSVTYKNASPYNDPMVLAWGNSQATGHAVTVTMPSSSQLSYGTLYNLTTTFNVYENIFVLADAAKDKYMFLYRSTSGGGTYGAVGSISAGNISFGSSVKVTPSVMQFQAADFNYENGTAFLAGDNFHLGNDPSGYALTIDGNEIKTSDVSPALSEFRGNNFSVCYLPTINTFACFFSGYTGDGQGWMAFVDSAKSSATATIGVTASAISDAATGTINLLGGISGGHTGLTVGADYYVQDDGTLGKTPTDSYIGSAISTTDINLVNSI